MLPSTGYFKAIFCPFYENGYCERPYCHFRHSRRDGASTSSVVTSEAGQQVQKSATTNPTTVTSANSDVIQQLVSEAVKKVLADQNVRDTENIVNKVVEGLKPKLVPAVLSATPTINEEVISQDPITKHTSVPVMPTAKLSTCVYNPTPIAELKKRHIPVPAYEPARESKAVKRKSPDVERPWMDIIRNISSIKESKVSYTPTAINQTVSSEKNSIHNYIPTIKSDTSTNLYNSTNSNDSYIPEKKRKKEVYCPKPKKRREEYVPRKPKMSLKPEQNLDVSFDILDEILGGSESNPSIVVEDESQDIIEVDPKFSDDDDVITIVNSTKDEKKLKNTIKNVSPNEKENEELQENPEINNESNDCSSNKLNKEKAIKQEESSKQTKDVSKNSSKSLEKFSKEDLKESKHKESSKHSLKKNSDSKHKNKEENSKHSKSKDEDSKHSKNKEDSRYIKTKEEDSKHSKSKDKAKEREKEKSKEKDKHGDGSKSSDKGRSSSSLKDNKNKDKDKDKIKDSRSSSKESSSSHRSKKDSKSNKEKRFGSKDLKDNRKENKGKSKYKSDEKDKHKTKSSSSDSKSKSNKELHKSSDRHASHSSHKCSKTDDKTSLEKEESVSDKNEEKSDQEERCDSPEYEEFSPFYDEQLLEDSDSDHDVEEECRKIFQEYEVSDHPKDMTSKAPPKPEIEESEEIFKKRVAHPSAGSNMMKQVGPTQAPKRLPNPQQRMYERWRLLKETAAEKAAEKAAASKALETFQKKQVEISSTTPNHDQQVNGNGRVRIAQVPYAMSLALEKKKVLEQAAKIEKTVAQNKKGGSRIAHIPQVVPQLIRPEPLQISGTQKFPLNVRQFYLNAMQDICIQIYTSADDAAHRAVREELTCYEKCKALNVYKNSCMLTVHRLRKEVDQKSEETSTSFSGMISHEAVLAGKTKGSWSVVKPRKVITDFKGASLYSMLTKWILTEQDLKDNGYPRSHPEGPKGRAKLYVSSVRGQSTLSKVANERFCCRCNKPFMVDKLGFPVRKENCIYHYARKFTFRGESKYMCCKQDGSSDGCCDATTHVWDYVDVENLRGYVSTFDKGNHSAEEEGIFALDCEMCYTTQGLELTRVTVINDECQVVYETLVKPPHPIIDYNTRFSGITEEDMKNVTTTLLDVQATLLSMFSSKTILIGHSLESDFKALKLLHDTVVDTSVMFPHKNGPPFKRALKNLCSEYLRIIIQNDLGGHDSKEDAVACMQLVLWKVKEEAKLQ